MVVQWPKHNCFRANVVSISSLQTRHAGVTSSNMLPPKPAAPSSAMGRDAVQEVEEHPEEFMASSHSMGSSHSGMRPVPPGQTPGMASATVAKRTDLQIMQRTHDI